MSDFLVGRMRRAINLDDKPRVEGSKVGDEAAKNNLTSKAEAADLLSSKTLPETSFGGRLLPV